MSLILVQSECVPATFNIHTNPRDKTQSVLMGFVRPTLSDGAITAYNPVPTGAEEPRLLTIIKNLIWKTTNVNR